MYFFVLIPFYFDALISRFKLGDGEECGEYGNDGRE
jgi:hypothetical protein